LACVGIFSMLLSLHEDSSIRGNEAEGLESALSAVQGRL
jgi:hypothetical protein